MTGKCRFPSQASRSKNIFHIREPEHLLRIASAAAFAVAILLRPEETKNTTIRVEGTEATWNEVVKLLERIRGKLFSVKYQSIDDTQAKEAEYWATGNPMAARYALRRIMAQGNAKVSVIQNDPFPEVKTATDLEKIITNVLTEQGIV